MGFHISLPEVLAVGATALFISGEYLVGGIFLSLSIVAGIMRAGVQLQEMKMQQEKFEQVTQMISRVGSYVDEFLKGIIFVTSQHQQVDDDDDPSNYN